LVTVLLVFANFGFLLSASADREVRSLSALLIASAPSGVGSVTGFVTGKKPLSRTTSFAVFVVFRYAALSIRIDFSEDFTM
jgi:hypothetical protein